MELGVSELRHAKRPLLSVSGASSRFSGLELKVAGLRPSAFVETVQQFACLIQEDFG